MQLPKLSENSALIVFSGGQDSTTCLYWSFREFAVTQAERRQKIKTVTFAYGQKHSVELEAAREICTKAGVDFDLVEFPKLLRSASPLVDHDQELDQYESIESFKPGVQPTFVPGRNVLFLTLAANYAYHHGIQNIVIGVCEEDFGGYYDCRLEFITKMQLALNQGLFGSDHGLQLHAPLMHLSKAQTVLLAKDLGEECMDAVALSHTCYAGERPGCGKCHACLLRARGFAEAGVLAR